MHATRRAFTLMELLVSMTVLGVIVFLVSQLFSSATRVTVGNSERLDADSQARVVFDHLALDLGKMLKRTDIDYLFAKINGTDTSHGENDKMFFYSEAPAYYDITDLSQLNLRSSVALIGYRINAAHQLERLGKQLTWDGLPSSASPSPSPGGIMFLAPPSSAPDPNTTNPASMLAGNWPNVIGSVLDSPVPYSVTTDNADYQVLADQVCRFEFCFQLKNGTFSPIPVSPVLTPVPVPVNNLSATKAPTVSADSTQGYTIGSRWYDNTLGRGYVCVNNAANAAVWNYLGMQDVRAVVVALAILDGTSAKLVPATTQNLYGQNVQVPTLDKVISALADANPTDVTSPSNPSTQNTVPNFAPTAGMPVRMMAEAWGNEIKLPAFATNCAIPARVAAQLRIYQRSFILNNQ